ncbi:hypothetical protein [Hymenobacter jeollabukensis]|uniref:Uncharacterized protein n=1 Tax=Hymenobacter jeollabukensis TaxID=2025313 RepID=A0A5R8WI87_9BACT|nr:hypothetical protein [Hymenobacter jeollabukensis]TLM87812.1 hypothetical protein FDY95_25275 [Hymenobacter jeollabukensis]
MINKKLNPLDLLPKGRRFNANQALKRKIASSFAADANDFLWRVGLLKDNRPHDTTSFFAKLYVDLLMSAECALKSLVVSLSPASETPEDAYLKIRSLGHKLDKLYEEVEHRATRRLKLLTPKQRALLMQANNIVVGYRYDITTFFFLSRESRLDRAFQRGPVSSILNYEFITAFYTMLHDLRDLADAAERKRFGQLAPLTMSQLGKVNKREDDFFAAVGRRL